MLSMKKDLHVNPERSRRVWLLGVERSRNANYLQSLIKDLHVNCYFIRMCCLLLLLYGGTINGQRKMEKLGRGVIATRTAATNVLVSWRLLGTEPQDIGFNVYRSENGGTPIKLNANVLLEGTNFEDLTANSTASNTYYIRTVRSAVEKESGPGYTLPANTPVQPFIKIPIRNITNYDVRFVFTGDLDGDGEFDFVLHKQPYSGSGPDLIEAYKGNGTYLWTMNGGPNSLNRDNISPGSSALNCGHGDNITVYDINSDGRSEVIMRTANGVVFANGAVLTDANNSHQYMSVIDGMTGHEISRTLVENPYLQRGPMNGHIGIGYLDGIHPSLVWESANRNADGSFNEIVTAWDWNGATLVKKWLFDLAGKGLASGHQIKLFDMDGDGKDEICPQAYVLDEDGTLKYNLLDQAIDHGDRFAIGDLDPAHPGLEMYGIQQGYSKLGIMWYYCDARTGKVLLSQSNPNNPDMARGMAGDFDPRYNGYELFTFVEGLYNVSGVVTSTDIPGSYPNFRMWWDGDLGSENLDNRKFTKWDYVNNRETRLYTASGVLQGDRNTPAFYGDILGDWREEAVYETSDHNSLVIYTSPYFTTHRIYTLPHNPGYRNDMTVRGYYQSHNTDFYLGYGMQQPPIPPIQDANAYWVGTTPVWDKMLTNWSDGSTARTIADGDTIMFDIRGNAADTIQLNTAVAPGKIWAMNPEGKNYIIAGDGKLTGAMELWKTGAGSFTLAAQHDYTGQTIVTEGLLNIDGSLQSHVIVKTLGAIGGRGQLLGGLSLDKGANIKGGRIHVGFGAASEQLGTLTVFGDLTLNDNNNLEFDIVPGSAQVNDSLVITGNLTINGANPLTVHFANDDYQPGTYTLISCKGTLTASLQNFVLTGVAGVNRELVIENNEVKIRIHPARDPGHIVWSGVENSLWDFNNRNFRLHDTATAFVSKDTITFDSTAVNTTIELNETVFPAAITFNATTDYTLQGTGSISGGTGMVKTNTNNVSILSTGNTYTGKTIVQGGTLTVAKLGLKNEASSIGAAGEAAENLQISNANLVINERSTTDRAMTINDTATITIPGATSYAIFMGNITGNGALVKDGPGAVFMIGAKSFTGPVIIRSGTVNLRTKAGNENGLGTSNNITIENGTLSMEDVRDYAQAYWNITVPQGKSATFNTDGRSTLRGALHGAGTLTVNIPYVRTDFRGNWSSFTGKINITKGDFRIGNNFGYANAAINLAGGYIYTISGASAAIAIGELAGASGTSLSSDISNASWIIGARNTDATFAGNINKGALIKTGTGTLTLTGNNAYNSNTSIHAGRVLVNNSASNSYGLGKGLVTVAGGGVLGGAGSVKGAITVQEGGTIQPGSNGIGILTDSTSVNFLSGAIAEMEIDKGAAIYDVLKVTGTVQFNGKLVIRKTDNSPFAGGDQFQLFQAGAYSGNFTAIEPAVPGEGMIWIFDPTTGTLTVKQTQAITFNALGEKGYGDAAFDPGASASSGLPIVYATSNPGVAEIVNGMVQIKALGIALISAAQPGNEIYAPAETVVQALIVKDKQAPGEPLSLTAKRLPDNKVGLLWLASTDDIGVTGYYVYRNGQLLNATPVTTTSYVTDAPAGNWNYMYMVKAVDSAGNLSGASNPADINVSPGEILFSLKVFPNPTPGICWLWFMSQQNGTVKIEIYNSNGALMQTVNDTKSGYFYQRQLNLSGMQKGMYLIRVTMGTVVQTKIILLQ